MQTAVASAIPTITKAYIHDLFSRIIKTHNRSLIPLGFVAFTQAYLDFLPMGIKPNPDTARKKVSEKKFPIVKYFHLLPPSIQRHIMRWANIRAVSRLDKN